MFLEMQRYNGIIFNNIVTANRARIINRYKNLKLETLKCDANIYSNKQYLEDHLAVTVHIRNILLCLIGENRDIS